MLKPNYETIHPDLGHSYKYESYDINSLNNNNKLKWHYHPEIELVYVNFGVGKRHVGTHLSNYTNGDLVLVGPYLPHTGFTKGFQDGQKEIVIQFNQDIFRNAFSSIEELKSINHLLELSKKGIVFNGPNKDDIGIRMEGLKYETQLDGLLTFIKILYDLSAHNEKQILNAEGYAFISSPTENKRLKIIFNYIRDNFMDQIALDDVASSVYMTPQSFCRFFKKSTGKTFTSFLNEYRINHATKLLVDTDIDVKSICFESGFNNLSNFFRNFKRITNYTPNVYRYQTFKKFET